MIFYILDIDGKIVETIQSPNEEGTGGISAIHANVEEKLSSYELLELVVPANSDGLEKIKEEMFLIFEDISGWREYTIYEIDDEDGGSFETTIRAELSSSELIDEIIEVNHRGTSKNPTTVLEKLLEGTRYSVGSVDSSVYSQDFNVDTEYMNVLEALNEYAKNYSAEIRFSYQVDGNKVVNRFVDVYKTFGEYKGKIFEIDRDMTSVKRTINTELIKTTIIPYSTEQRDQLEDGEEGKPYRIDIKDIEWSKAKGDPVDKPLGQNYLVDPVALENWGTKNSDGTRRHRKISMEFDLDNAESIIKMAWVQLGRYTQPRVTYEVQAIDLYAMTQDEDLKHEQILIGDTAGVKDHYFSRPIEIQTRLIEVNRDLFDSRNNDYVFGSSRTIFSVNTSIERVEDAVSNIEDVVKKFEDFQTTIDERNRIFRGSTIPAEPIENDIWFRPHPSKQGNTQMLVYNGVSWVIEADSSDLEDASKLKFGVIDGAQINVINLIADNITGGQLKLENGLEITNRGVPILKVNEDGEVQLNIKKLTIGVRDIEDELNKKVDADFVEGALDGISLENKTDILSGTEIYTDKADDSVVHVDVDGKSYQNAGTGKNILAEADTKIDSDAYMLKSYQFNQSPIEGEQYTVTLKGALGSDRKNFQVYNSGGSVNLAVLSDKGGGIYQATFPWKIGSSPNKSLYLYHINNTSTSKSIVEWIQLEEGSIATPYEPPAPSPDYPIPIDSLNNFDVVSSVGKRNLLSLQYPITSHPPYNTNWEVVGDRISTVFHGANDYLTLRQNDTDANSLSGVYTFSGYLLIDGQIPKTNIFKNNYLSTRAKAISYRYNPSTGYVSFTGDYDGYGWSPIHTNGVNIPDGSVLTIIKPKLEKGTDSTGWNSRLEDIPYDTIQDGVYKTNILLDEPLRSVGDVKDKIFRDIEDGLWKVERNVGEYEVQGTEAIRKNDTNSDNTLYYFLSRNELGISPSEKIQCSHLPTYSSVSSINNGTVTGINNKANTVVYFNLGEHTTTNSLEFIQQWMKNNKPTILHELAEPTTEIFPDSMQVSLNSIASFKGENYVYTMVENENLRPELHATFKSKGWFDKWKTEQELIKQQKDIDSKATQEDVDKVASDLTDFETIMATKEELGEILSSLNDYREVLEKSEQDVAQAKQDIVDLLERVPIISENLGEFVRDFNFINTYIRMGDEGLLIQELNGSTGIKISNDRIDFIDGDGDPVAFITGQIMQINRGIFVKSAQIGQHKIETVAGGHTIFTWMG